ncbi:hypothetical protein BDN72DRAFT_61607 [Pluteus cervinus]|uniref:Uncharacterized protein n=1 Tax=Pluteus cervinus TaxID=181527 RepID=A0ACD3AQN4_9AGAR|nr:hypothetical protein BDN72DRAFT_61607 [Pluteus cervinus]
MPSLGLGFPDVLQGLFPKKSLDLQSEMTCYGLPYGVLGLLSHLFTLYTIACLHNLRSPLWPAHKFKPGSLNLLTGILGVTASPAIALYTISTCLNTFELLLIGLWQFSVSLVNGLYCFCVAVWVKKESEEMIKKVCVWPSVALYLLGTISGMIGLLSLMFQSWPNGALQDLVIGFGTFYVLLTLGIALVWFESGKTGIRPGYILAILAVSPLLCDLVLGILADNVVGVPVSGMTPLFVVYLIGKHLPMLRF